MIDTTTFFWLNSVSMVYLLVTSAILLRNRFEFKSLKDSKHHRDDNPKISVCIPARNEKLNIERVLRSACNQSYDNFEILVLDDFSTDNTPELIEKVKKEYPGKIKSVQARKKPDDWLGKPWACHQLGKDAEGDLLLFIDADTALKPSMLKETVSVFEAYNLDMMTVWPEQEVKSFWEKMVVPLIYYTLVTLLPAVYVYRSPRWIPSFLRSAINPLFAAACGQCIGFTKQAYHTIGGHSAVKREVVEDVALAKKARSCGLRLRMLTGIGSISCRMYRSEQEIFNGLRKNFLPGFNRSIPLFLFMALLHLVVFVLPFLTLLYALYYGYEAIIFLSAGSVSMILLQRFIIDVWFRWNPVFGFLHPVSVLWFQRLGVYSIADHLSGRSVKWKGRNV